MKNTCPVRSMLLLYTIILLLSTCNYPTNETYDIIEEEVAVSDDNDDEIIIIQEVQTMELQPIKEYQKYITSNRVYGINGDEAEGIVLLDNDNQIFSIEKFFIVDGMIYLSVVLMEPGEPDGEPTGKEYFFSQTGGMIQEELEKDFPKEPVSEHVEYEDALFKIETSPYEIEDEMTDTSRVYRGPSPEAYLQINGCARVSGGFWFSVPFSFATRLKGVYFYPESGVKNRVMIEGRIW